MPGRHANTSDYRYGFQGSEKDDEIKGEGNSYTTYFRAYDPRIGRWLSRDPIKTAWESPYAFSRNNPIVYNDPLGDCPDGNCGDEDIVAAEEKAQEILDKKGNRGVDHSFFGVKIGSKPKIQAEINQEVWKAAEDITGVDVPALGHFDEDWVQTKDGKAYIATFNLIKKLYQDKATLSYANKELNDAFSDLIESESNPQLKVAMIANRAKYVEDYKIRTNLIEQGVGTTVNAGIMAFTGRYSTGASRSRGASFAVGGQMATQTAKKQLVNFTDDVFTSFVTKEKMTVYRVWGGNAKEGGRWFFSSSTKPLLTTSNDAIINLKLYNNAATKISTFEIPAGTRIYVGGIKGGHTGAVQIYTESRAIKIGDAVKLPN